MTGIETVARIFADLLEVAVRAEVEVLGRREVRERFREGVRVDVHRAVDSLALAGDLLLEERVHHDRGRARVLEPLDRVEIVHERRGARHERVGEGQAEVGRSQVHVRRPQFPGRVAASATCFLASCS